MGFPELVDGSIEDRDTKDKSPVDQVDEKSSWNPYRTGKLHSPGFQRGEEIFQDVPGFSMKESKMGKPESFLLTHAT